MFRKLVQNEWELWRFSFFKNALETRWKCFRTTLCFVLFLALIYYLSNQFEILRLNVSWRPHKLFSYGGELLDRKIPFIPETVHVYNTLTAFFFIPCLFYQKSEDGKHAIRKMLQAQVLLSCTAITFFILLPSPVDMRDQVHELLNQRNDRLYSTIFTSIYYVDTHFNSWPCLHIAHPLLITLTVQPWIKRKSTKILLWIWLILLLISIATTKQHFIWDLITGSLLGLGFYRLTQSKETHIRQNSGGKTIT